MPDRLGYVVVTWNQASHMPGLEYSDLHADLESARWDREDKQRRTAEVGRRETHAIAEVVELEEDDG
jgi:hypothetical protein